MRTVKEIMTDERWKMICTWVICWRGMRDIITREHIDMAIRDWGDEEVEFFSPVSTREMVLDIPD